MEACSFDESNYTLHPPEGMTAEECNALSVWVGEMTPNNGMGPIPGVISCWKLRKEELEEINRTGRVWLVIYGRGMPPVALQTKKPFE